MWTGQGCICEEAALTPDVVKPNDYDNPTFAESGHTTDCEADGLPTCNDARCKHWDYAE